MKGILSVVLATAVLSASAGFASFTYRGGIGNEAGEGLANSNVTVTVRLYADAAATTALWSGVTNVLTEASGVFQVDVSDALPSVADEPRGKSVAALLQSGEATCVGITLGDDPETYPRQPFVTFPVVCESAVSVNCNPASVDVQGVRVRNATVSDRLDVTGSLSANTLATTNAVLNRAPFALFDVRQAECVTAFSRADDCPYSRSGVRFESSGSCQLYQIFPPEQYEKVTRGGMLTFWSSDATAMFKCVTFPVAAGENFTLPPSFVIDQSSYQCLFLPFADE